MKLYEMDLWFAPNPRRVSIYLAEKRLDVERVVLNAEAREHKSPAFLAKNPAGKLPVLELDDGQCILDSGAIVEYLEERHPAPPMLGGSPEERARIRSLERMTTDLLWLTAGILRNSHPFFATWGAPKNPGAVEYAAPRFHQLIGAVDTLVDDHTFAAGDSVSIADCTLCAALDFAFEFGGIEREAPLTNLDRWYAAFRQRPSASAGRRPDTERENGHDSH